MKNRTDRILLAVFLLSLALYAALLWESIEGSLWPWPLWFQRSQPYLLLSFHAVPAFCLQLLLCRGGRRWLRALPLVLPAIPGALALIYLIRDSGWDRLGALAFGLGAIAPAVGCALAWMAYGVQALRKRGGPGG